MVKKIGIIRVITTADEFILYTQTKKLQAIWSDLHFVTKAIPDQPLGVYDVETEKIAIPKVIKLACDFEKEGMDGIFISCCADPGLNEVQNAVSIPVVGAGQAAALYAKALSSKVGVLSITEEIPSNLETALDKKLLGYCRPEGVENTFDLLTPQGQKSILDSSRKLILKGADCLLLGCTGMSTIGIANFIEEKLNVKVIDPLVAGGSLLNYLVRRLEWQN